LPIILGINLDFLFENLKVAFRDLNGQKYVLQSNFH